MTTPAQFDLFTPPPVDTRGMSDEEARVARVLSRHYGRGRAVTSFTLATLTGLGDRALRRVCRDLVMRHGVAVCSVTGGAGAAPGFYLAATAEELRQVTAGLKTRGVKILARAAALEKRHLAEYLGQVKLEIEGGEDGGALQD